MSSFKGWGHLDVNDILSATPVAPVYSVESSEESNLDPQSVKASRDVQKKTESESASTGGSSSSTAKAKEPITSTSVTSSGAGVKKPMSYARVAARSSDQGSTNPNINPAAMAFVPRQVKVACSSGSRGGLLGGSQRKEGGGRASGGIGGQGRGGRGERKVYKERPERVRMQREQDNAQVRRLLQGFDPQNCRYAT